MRRRALEIKDAGVDSLQTNSFDDDLLEEYFQNKTILIDRLGENYAAWVYPPFKTSLLSHELARIAQKNSEETTVFSQYNW